MRNEPRQRDLAHWWSSSHLAGASAGWLEQLYQDWRRNPDSVAPQWAVWFASLPDLPAAGAPARAAAPRAGPRVEVPEPEPCVARPGALHRPVERLIEAHRALGHLAADLDPLGLREIPRIPALEPSFHGLSEADLEVTATDVPQAFRGLPLREVLRRLRQVYCGTLATEYVHVADPAELAWIRDRLEAASLDDRPAPVIRAALLRRLTAAEVLEQHLHRRYVGQKRFSLEGAEALIPLLDEVIQRGGAEGIREMAIGMAHRGRLNVLVNIMGKSPADLFREFEGDVAGTGTGDVKYHLGFSSNMTSPGGPLHISLAFNPSHLEIVGPVVQGSVRARQERRGDRDGTEVMPVVIHGDAAFAGQGVVMETFNMSQSRGYSTKGTVHVVVNNQIGFTTSNQKDARSTLYATDVAKMVNAPIFHVNGDDPEAVRRAALLATEYRMRFRKDVVIDLVCYRRHGHSEADEPAVTQPVMYRTIRRHPSVRQRYAERLVADGVLPAAEAEAMIAEYERALESGERLVPYLLEGDELRVRGEIDWMPHIGNALLEAPDTRIGLGLLRELADRMGRLPAGFELHPNVARIYDNRRKMAAGALPIDWGFAELLAYASLVTEGFGVRLSGQDSTRGTFFHRHAAIHHQGDDSVYVPLRHIAPDQANFLVINSLLSEEAVLAFEYGYATTDPNTLVIWEAQFGDFANNAQVVIDQFISAGEQKWDRLSGVVLFLPHGYEGQGPEHSSARLERFLQLCAQHNMQVCSPTMPSQMFHLLRRQMRMRGRKPLIVMTPKSLLRHRRSVSALEDLTQGAFHRVLDDPAPDLDPAQVRRVIVCAGKVFFDLLERRETLGRGDVALIRLEQLYPFPEAEARAVLARYPAAEELLWCQEEPRNQGGWYPLRHRLVELAPGGRLAYAGRAASASPAVGYPRRHIEQLNRLLDEAFGPWAALRDE